MIGHVLDNGKCQRKASNDHEDLTMEETKDIINDWKALEHLNKAKLMWIKDIP